MRAIASRVHHVTYNLNALTGNAYIPLYDSYQDIRTILDDILSGNIQALACPPVVSLDEIGWEMEQVVGIDLACLAELRHHSEIKADPGFVVTADGIRSLCANIREGSAESRQRTPMETVRNEMLSHFHLLAKIRKTDRFSITLARIDHDTELIRELAVVSLIPDTYREAVEIVVERAVDGMLPRDDSGRPLADESRDEDWALPYSKCLERVVRMIYEKKQAGSDQAPAMFVAFVRGVSPPAVLGTVRTRGGSVGLVDGMTLTSHVPGSDQNDILLFRRNYPYDLLQSIITPHSAGFRFADGREATDGAAGQSGLGRGSALLEDSITRSLVKTSILLERMLGAPVEVEWERRPDGNCRITRLTPVRAAADAISEELLAGELGAAEVLCRDGTPVQLGIAAGNVVHVTDEMAPQDFPLGGIAVARVASPQLTPILQRAAAVVTEFGNATGHLATVARELRLPAIFGASRACSLLPEEEEVTVDAGEITVYSGVLELLLARGAGGMDLSPADQEYRILRCLLRFIMPLNLIDPEAANFTPAGCRTFHDIIHFSHEKAVEELAHFQERRPELGSIRTRRMQLEVPMDIRVLDIGGGLAADPAHEPTRTAIRSEPFSAFLDGLLQPEAAADDLPSLGLRDIISSVPRSMGMLSGPSSGLLGENLAIISRDYLNLSLRLGYHFSVVDAHLGGDVNRDYVYFRFTGGLADPERRGRRVKFISQVLAAMDFKVMVKGDLAVGRLKLAAPSILRIALYILGALTTFSRQRDTVLYSDAETRALFKFFSDTFLCRYHEAVTEAYEQQSGSVGQWRQATESLTAGPVTDSLPSPSSSANQ